MDTIFGHTERVLESLTQSQVDIKAFFPNVSFSSPWNHQKTKSFLMFSWGQRGTLGRKGLTTCTSVLCLGFSTTDAKYIIRQIQKKHFITMKIYFAFADLGEALGWVPRSIICWATKEVGNWWINCWDCESYSRQHPSCHFEFYPCTHWRWQVQSCFNFSIPGDAIGEAGGYIDLTNACITAKWHGFRQL